MNNLLKKILILDRGYMLKREKINKVVHDLIEQDSKVEHYIIEDYEKLKNKCDEIIIKIKNRKRNKKIE